MADDVLRVGRVSRVRSASEKICDAISLVIVCFIPLIDISLGVIVLFLSYFPMADYNHLWAALNSVGLTADAPFWGLVYLLTLSGLWVVNGFYQFVRICIQSNDIKFDFVKFGMFIGLEAVGFVLISVLIPDSTRQLQISISYGTHNQYMIFHLLLINPVTVGVLVYQIASFLLVQYINFKNMERRENEILAQGSNNPGNSNGNNNDAYGIPSANEDVDEMMRQMSQQAPDQSFPLRPMSSPAPGPPPPTPPRPPVVDYPPTNSSSFVFDNQSAANISQTSPLYFLQDNNTDTVIYNGPPERKNSGTYGMNYDGEKRVTFVVRKVEENN